MNTRLREMKLGFPGIGNSHLSLVEFSSICSGDIFIYDQYLMSETRDDEAPLMLKYLGDYTYFIEGIGCGVDSKRDPDRIILRYGGMVREDTILPTVPVLRVDVRPTLGGGPGYYYFFKSYRDFRL
jgi:hypothetical protein